jgi:hypothetical protein
LGISLPVGSHLDESQARRTTQQAEDYFSTAGRRAGDEFSRQVNQGISRVDTVRPRAQAAALERAYDRAADAAGKLRAEQAKLDDLQARGNATNAQLIAQSERLERVRRAEARAVRDVVDALREYQSGGDDSSSATAALTSALGPLSSAAESAKSTFNDLTAATSEAVISMLPFIAKATGAVGALGAVGGAATEMTGILGTIPGVVAGTVAAFGSLQLATLGFSDAIGDIKDQKKFAEDLQDLSPNAQQAALAIQQMMPAFEQLKNSAQDALFAGVGQQLNQLTTTYLPAVQQMTTSIASSFGQMFSGLADQLMTPETQAAIRAAMANISQAFQNLVPAIGPVTKAISDLVNVSSSFLPGFATGIANAATEFSNFLSNAAQTGELRQWIQQGVDAFKELGALVPTIKDLFLDFKSNGKTAMEDIVWVTKTLLEALGWIGDKYDALSNGVKMFANTWVANFNAIGRVIDTTVLAPMRSLISMYNKLAPITGNKIELPEFTPVAPPAPGSGTIWDAIRNGGATSPGQAVAPPGLHPGTNGPGGMGNSATASLVPAYPTSGWFAVPAVPDKPGKKQPLPTVPMGNNDPLSLLQGFPADAGLYSAAGTVLDNQQKVAQAKSDLNTLEKANVRDEDAIVAKKNELARAQREEHESELRLNEAKAQAVQKSLKGMQTASGELQQLGVQLDKDFGISKGLGGIVENAVKALGNILAAPFLQALGFVAKANPNEGSGLMGILAANGAFGSQYTPGAIAMMQASQRSGGGGGYPGIGPVAGIPAMAGESGRDFAHRAMMPYWQSMGFQVGDHAADKYGEHQNGALDIMVPSIAAGQQVLQQVLRDPNVYGAIFDNKTYGYGRGTTPQDYTAGHTGNPTQDHQDHVHAWYKPGGKDNIVPGAADATGSLNSLASAANSAASALSGPAGGWNADWLSTAQKESSGNWAANTGNGHSGGLQFSPPSWAAAGGTQYAPEAWQATPYQQAMTAENLLAMQGPGAWPNTFTPGSAGPAAPGAGPMYPGIGPSQALPGISPLGPVTPAVGGGTAYPSQGGNSGNLLGGMAMDGIMAATAGLDMMAPGTSAAAKIGIQVANRTIGYAAQNAGILANGIGEFFSIGDNPKGSLGAGWLGKLAGGIAGAGAALPNIAGQKAPQQQGNGQQQGGNTNNVNNTINVQAREGASGQEHGEQVAAETSRMYAPAGRQ